jgi:hypothetical protein
MSVAQHSREATRRTAGVRRRSLPVIAILSCLALLLIVTAASAGIRWTLDGVPVRALSLNSATMSQAVSDGNGGAIIAWQDNRSGNDNIFVQRLTSTGAVATGWTADGIAIRNLPSNADLPRIVSDGLGGAIVTWEDYRSGHWQIYAQRIQANGNIPWTANGIGICTLGTSAMVPRIVSDNAGGAIIAWRDGRSGRNDIYAQRVQLNGTVNWDPNGNAIRSASADNTDSIAMAPDGLGGAVLAWADNRSGSEWEVYAQRVRANGTTVWITDGVGVRTAVGALTAGLNVQVLSDTLGGAFVTWDDNRSGSAQIYASRVIAAGFIAPGWTPDGEGIRTLPAGAGDLPMMVSNGATGAIIAWQDSRSGSGDLYAQELLAGGSTGWTSQGVPVRAGLGGEAIRQQMIAGESGGAVLTWQDDRAGKEGIYAQRIAPDGSVAPGWAVNGEPIRTGPPNNAEYPCIATDEAGGAIIAWEDNRAATYWDIYAQRIDNDPPTVTSMTPNAARQGDTVNVTDIAGTNFYGTPTVRLMKPGQTDVVATNVNTVSSTKLTCTFTVPFSAGLGRWNLSVENPDSQGATAANAFTISKPPNTVWYLAEGTTAWGFGSAINIQNPNAVNCNARITYMLPGGATKEQVVGLPPASQVSVNPADTVGSSDFSTKVECTQGRTIAVDRTMAWSSGYGQSLGEHNSIGVTAPAKTWYLPEGSSAWGYESWLLIQNPGDTQASCDVTYMIEGVGPRTINHKIAAHSRATFNMFDEIGEADASIKVDSDIAVIPERAMYTYWNSPEQGKSVRREGHDSIGTTVTAKDFYLAEGTSAWGFMTYILVQNPNDSAATVQLTCMTNNGPSVLRPFSMPANSRKTVRMNDVIPNQDFSTRVHADKPIVAERAMYWSAGDSTGKATHDSIGIDAAHTNWYLPDGGCGTDDGGTETFTLVQNPNSSQVAITVTYMSQGGTNNIVFTDTIGANSRKTYNMADQYGQTANIGASILVQCNTAGRKIIVERAVYANGRWAGTDTIGGWSD